MTKRVARLLGTFSNLYYKFKAGEHLYSEEELAEIYKELNRVELDNIMSIVDTHYSQNTKESIWKIAADAREHGPIKK